MSGRKPTNWPDDDAPGADYAKEVAAILTVLGCEASLIDAATLARIDPNGGSRDPTKKGWDAADALLEWADIEALRSAALGLAKPYVANETAPAGSKPTPDEDHSA